MNTYALLSKDKFGEVHRLTYVHAQTSADVLQAAEDKLDRPGRRHILARWKKDGGLFMFAPDYN